MFTVPAQKVVREFREYLDAHDYNAASIAARLGSASPPRRDAVPAALHMSREASSANALTRLFLIGASLEASVARASLGESFVKLCERAGLIEFDGGRLHATVVIVPVDELLIASDAFRQLGTEHASDFVLPASAHSANYLRMLTMRTPVGHTLDLGCGCGIQALFAAAHSDSVVASDISESAVNYTTFNARLNGIDNIDCVRGNFFEPLADRKFDLIVCNPPFVPGPDERFVYRDSPLELDQLCRQLLRDAPAHLEQGGHLQMLCESVEVAGEPWRERIGGWVDAIHCDAWILHHPPVAPADYVSRRIADVDTAGCDGASDFDAWLRYFVERDVAAIHPCMAVLRRRDGTNWSHVHNVAKTIIRPAGESIARSIATFDLLNRCRDDEQLLVIRFGVAPQLKLEQRFGYDDGAWKPERSVFVMNDALAMEAEVDVPVVAFVNQLNGDATLGESIARFAEQVGAEPQQLRANLLPLVRLFVGRGFLVPKSD